MSFDVNITDFNNPPTITIPSNYQAFSVQPGSPSSIIPITVHDGLESLNWQGETAETALTLRFTSDTPTLIPNAPANLTETGSGANRGLIITSVPNLFGTAKVTVTVTDTGLPSSPGTDVKSSSAVITVTVAAGQAPTISQVSTNGIPTSSVVTKVNTDSDIISFTVNDAQTAAGSLIVTAASDNQTLVPDGNVQFGGSGANRLMIIRPNSNQAGIANIRLTVKDADGNTASTTFQFTVFGAPPTITAVADQQIAVGGSTPTLSFTVNSTTTFAGFLVVTASSDSTALVPSGNIFLGGSGASRTVKVVAVAGQNGTATITLTVQDNQGQTSSTSFKVATPPVVQNQAPTISRIENKTVVVGTTIPIITFTVADDNTAVADIKVAATSSNSTLIPPSNIFLGGNTGTRTMLLNPAAGKTGTALITVTVTDTGSPALSSSTSFSVNITPQLQVVANDFNADGIPDIIFQDGAGNLGAWFMSGETLISGAYFKPGNVGTGWTVVGTGDFNADTKTDLLLQKSDGTLAVWYMDGGVNMVSGAFLSPSGAGADWKAVGVADFDKDGKPDVLFQKSDGTLAVWYLNNTTLTGAAYLSPASAGSASWKAVGAGDFNGDGKPDVLFQNSDGTMAVWYMNGVNLSSGEYLSPSNPGANWKVAGLTDQNNDGKPDILFQNSADGSLAIWYMNGSKIYLGKMLNPSNAGSTWQIVAP